jgi:hypothetical protein
MRRRPVGDVQTSGKLDSTISEGEGAVSDSCASDAMTDSRHSPTATAPAPTVGTKALSATATKERERKIGKMIQRSVLAMVMMSSFGFIIYLGHCYLCLLVIFLQTAIFQELVGVRIKQSAEKKMPFFRTLQWGWFLQPYSIVMVMRS